MNPSIADDPAKDTKYAEPAIDSLRTQKDEVSGEIVLLFLVFLLNVKNKQLRSCWDGQ